MPRPIPATYPPVSAVEEDVRKEHVRQGLAAEYARQKDQDRRALTDRAAAPLIVALRARTIAFHHAILAADSMATFDAALSAFVADFRNITSALRDNAAAVLGRMP